jgi:hypothetical protein
MYQNTRTCQILKITATTWSSGPERFDFPLATQSLKMKIYGNTFPFIQCAMGYSDNDNGGA